MDILEGWFFFNTLKERMINQVEYIQLNTIIFIYTSSYAL